MSNKIKQGGFTLIELLIVIGIIAILAAGIIIAINPGAQFEAARNSTRWSHMNAIANAVYSYAVDNNGDFPACVTEGPTSVDNCALAPTYISAIPEDPQGGSGANNYQIELVDDGTRIKIIPGNVADDTEELELVV